LRTPERYLNFERGGIYLLKENQSTLESIKGATQFILKNTSPKQRILAVPAAPLYCFLSGRDHAARELYFSGHSRLRDWQEERIVRDLEAEEAPLFLLTNLDNQGPGMGKFGETHSQKLGKYLFEHYQETTHFGHPWEVPNARTSHAVKIFQRKKR
jgi:hypothetical protein